MGNWAVQSGAARGACLAAALAFVASCSGGGGGGSQSVEVGNSLVFTAPAASVTEGGAALQVQVRLQAPLGPLSDPLQVDVVDLGSGTATAGVDYAAFGVQSVTFPAGSDDGDLRTVSLTTLTDGVVEGADETVVLELQSPSSGSIGSVPQLTATIEDGEVATLRFSAGSGSTADESSVPHDVDLELDLPPGANLGVDVTVVLSDLGSGSATSGLDYAAVATREVTFTAGSPDGATRSVAVDVLDDAQPELAETVVLGLAAPSTGAVLGANLQYELTITDDDASGMASLVTSHGPSGVETTLSHDDVVDLGNQTVGAGPNAGTSLRISNLGSSSMALGTPILSGANPTDFAIEIELAPLVAAGQAEPEDLATPLTASVDAPPGPGVALALDLPSLAVLESHGRARLHGFPVPGHGEMTLELEQVALPIADGAQLVVDGVPVPGGLAEAVQGVTVWRGSALEMPGSRAFLTFSPEGPQGFLELEGVPGRVLHLFTESAPTTSGATVARVVHEEDLLALGLDRTGQLCGGVREVPGQGQMLAPGIETLPEIENLTAANCRLAIETDYQLYQKFGSVSGTTNYVTQLIAAVSDQYFTDVQCTLSIEYLGVYSTAGDPWTSQDTGGDAGDLLDEFQAAWSGGWPVSADLAHFISGAGLGGGVAYVNVLCSQGFGFGVSGNINGNIDWGGWSGAPASFTWDFVVVAHELGHNFGTGHTHDYCPPIDQCYANCDGSTSCSQGTIMSYCHTCGGMDNIDLNFHPVVANRMRTRIQSSCLGDSTLAAGDHVQYLVRFNPSDATGARSAVLEFEHDAGNAPNPFRLQLQGTAD